MASVMFSTIGQAVGGPMGAAIGASVGASVDGALFAPRRNGQELLVQRSAYGEIVPKLFGRMRMAGQLIWALPMQSGARKGSGRRTAGTSFAVALSARPILGIGRIWADGKPMDLSGVTWRWYPGDETQAADPFIAARMGAANTPAYRGTAYVVFEDLPLGPFGDRVPQLNFEVFRRPRGAKPRLEDRLEGVCLIPGAGEFALATQAVVRREGLTRTTVENVHNGEGRPDLLVSLDQLQA